MNQSPITFAPRSQLRDHFRQGWRLIPGHQYDPNDYAILLEMGSEAPAEDDIRRWSRLFDKHPRKVRSNKSAAGLWGGKCHREQAFARRLARQVY